MTSPPFSLLQVKKEYLRLHRKYTPLWEKEEEERRHRWAQFLDGFHEGTSQEPGWESFLWPTQTSTLTFSNFPPANWVRSTFITTLTWRRMLVCELQQSSKLTMTTGPDPCASAHWGGGGVPSSVFAKIFELHVYMFGIRSLGTLQQALERWREKQVQEMWLVVMTKSR